LPKDRWPHQPTLSPGCSSKENIDPGLENVPQLSTEGNPSSLQKSPLSVTRGRAMVLAVKIASKPSTVASGINQSVSVGESPFFDSDTTSEPDDPERDRLWLLRPLARPCIKIVDLKARTRPSYMEKTNYMECLWRSFSGSASAATVTPKTPVLLNAPQASATPAGTSTTPLASVGLPLSTNVVTSQHTTGLSKRDIGAKNSPGVSLIGYKGLSSSKRRKLSTKRSRGTLAEPSGYCECCLSRFNSLYTHVTGAYHMDYATNAENFRQLDQLLSEIPSMREALAKARGVKVADISPPSAENSPTSHNEQVKETEPQPSQAAHEPIDDAVVDFSALPPLPLPSVPQDCEVELFSESDEHSSIGIMGDLSSMFVGEASPTLQPISINSPTTYSSPLPPLALAPSATLARDVEQVVSIPLERGVPDRVRDHCRFVFRVYLSTTSSLQQIPEPGFFSPYITGSNPSGDRSGSATDEISDCAAKDRHVHCARYHQFRLDCIASKGHSCPIAAITAKEHLSSTKEALQKCGGASPDHTRDTQPPSCSHFLSSHRSRAHPNKHTRRIAQKAKPNLPFPCGVCGNNVNYKVWSVLCSTCGLWVHANCSKMKLSQIRKLPESHSWICPTCHVR
uniref:DBF4-type domain-containing protein n=1 Tax=Hydatigena taeniaeformis TaxID=6205 RepID=A0A0R3X1C1_HYDTA